MSQHLACRSVILTSAFNRLQTAWHTQFIQYELCVRHCAAWGTLPRQSPHRRPLHGCVKSVDAHCSVSPRPHKRSACFTLSLCSACVRVYVCWVLNSGPFACSAHPMSLDSTPSLQAYSAASCVWCEAQRDPTRFSGTVTLPWPPFPSQSARPLPLNWLSCKCPCSWASVLTGFLFPFSVSSLDLFLKLKKTNRSRYSCNCMGLGVIENDLPFL